MTPATRLLDARDVAYRLHEYDPNTADTGYGIDAADQLGVDRARVFKTLIAELDRHELVVAIVAVAARLDMKQLARAAGAKKAFMADGAKAEKTTGYVMGGISPFGQKKTLRVFIDDTATCSDTIFVSGGRRGLEIEIAPRSLIEITGATPCAIAAS